ncbi:expressed protein [Dictyostelium purpureum]|uniref:Expressed protein n=1 Tax=Dictyostelium purpureum TaxID=5786 RepID=F0ZD39_DICPU|nr:uncharacterized protein DICPUDRAFT_96999 [Dictyostelium purpureum]EGC38133.1 expressed protein [Dictyostelium purpureum]|eukprot:XP_003285347.1 expressed protein [Dictyostelium purpureum]
MSIFKNIINLTSGAKNKNQYLPTNLLFQGTQINFGINAVTDETENGVECGGTSLDLIHINANPPCKTIQDAGNRARDIIKNNINISFNVTFLIVNEDNNQMIRENYHFGRLENIEVIIISVVDSNLAKNNINPLIIDGSNSRKSFIELANNITNKPKIFLENIEFSNWNWYNLFYVNVYINGSINLSYVKFNRSDTIFYYQRDPIELFQLNFHNCVFENIVNLTFIVNSNNAEFRNTLFKNNSIIGPYQCFLFIPETNLIMDNITFENNYIDIGSQFITISNSYNMSNTFFINNTFSKVILTSTSKEKLLSQSTISNITFIGNTIQPLRNDTISASVLFEYVKTEPFSSITFNNLKIINQYNISTKQPFILFGMENTNGTINLFNVEIEYLFKRILIFSDDVIINIKNSFFNTYMETFFGGNYTIIINNSTINNTYILTNQENQLNSKINIKAIIISVVLFSFITSLITIIIVKKKKIIKIINKKNQIKKSKSTEDSEIDNEFENRSIAICDNITIKSESVSKLKIDDRESAAID